VLPLDNPSQRSCCLSLGDHRNSPYLLTQLFKSHGRNAVKCHELPICTLYVSGQAHAAAALVPSELLQRAAELLVWSCFSTELIPFGLQEVPSAVYCSQSTTGHQMGGACSTQGELKYIHGFVGRT
jgi:hypothetical protein